MSAQDDGSTHWLEEHIDIGTYLHLTASKPASSIKNKVNQNEDRWWLSQKPIYYI
jgi:hypothetical protein